MSGVGAFLEGLASGVEWRKERTLRERELALAEKTGGYAHQPRSIMGGGGADSGQAAINAASMPTGVNAADVRAGLIKRGMAPHLADGFILNFQDESALNTSAVGDNGNAFGLGQWNGPRMRNLKAFAAAKGVDPSNTDLQLDFLMDELQGAESGAWSKIQKAQTAGEAGAAIVNFWERPAEKHRARREAAYRAYGAGPAPEEPAPTEQSAAPQARSIIPTTPGIASAFSGQPPTRVGSDPLSFILGKIR